MRTVERIRAAMGRYRNVSEIKMFGGLCFTLNGNMCIGTLKDDLVVRIDPAEAPKALRKPGVRPMNFTGRTMKGFLFVGPQAYRTDKALREWVAVAAAWVSTMPPKAGRGRKAASPAPRKGARRGAEKPRSRAR